MAGIVTKRRISQPNQFLPLNEKYSSGLVLATEYQHNVAVDLLGLSVTGTSGSYGCDEGGRGYLTTADGQYMSWGNPASMQFTETSSWTMLSLFVPTGNAGANVRMLMAKDSGSSPRALFHFRIYNDVLEGVWGLSSATLGSIIGTETIGTAARYGELHCAAFRRIAGSSATLFLDGRIDKTGADGATSTWTVSGGNVRTDYEAAANSSWRGWKHLDLVWNRALSDSDLLELTENPWLIYAPEVKRIWVPVSAGGGDTLITLTAASLGLTPQAYQQRATANLSAASLSFTAQSIQPKTTLALAASALSFVANSAAYTTTLSLAAAALSFTANAITVTQNRLIQLTAAVLAFTAQAITISGVVSATINDFIVWARRRDRR